MRVWSRPGGHWWTQSSDGRSRKFSGRCIVRRTISVQGRTFSSTASIDVRSGSAKNAAFSVKGHVSDLNSARLTSLTREKAEGTINANFLFSGLGLDINEGIDLSGYFYITDIGPKTADNLLLSLDPESADSGIRNTRFLLKHGFKPKLMSFEIKHGYFYPRIDLSQPWYFPAKIRGGKVELNRIPIQLFIRTFLQSEEEYY